MAVIGLACCGRAFALLLVRFPTWESLLGASPMAIAEAIRVGGLARVKAPRIKASVKSATWWY
jgi:endonuclease-3